MSFDIFIKLLPHIMAIGSTIGAIILFLVVQAKMKNFSARKVGKDAYIQSPLDKNDRVSFPISVAPGSAEYDCLGLSDSGRYVNFKNPVSGNIKHIPIIGFETREFEIVGIKEEGREDG